METTIDKHAEMVEYILQRDVSRQYFFEFLVTVYRFPKQDAEIICDAYDKIKKYSRSYPVDIEIVFAILQVMEKDPDSPSGDIQQQIKNYLLEAKKTTLDTGDRGESFDELLKKKFGGKKSDRPRKSVRPENIEPNSSDRIEKQKEKQNLSIHIPPKKSRKSPKEIPFTYGHKLAVALDDAVSDQTIIMPQKPAADEESLSDEGIVWEPISAIALDDQVNVVDQTNEFDRIYDNLRTGKLGFNPPPTMQVGISERIEATISRNLNKKIDEFMKGRGEVLTETIKVSPYMKLKLSGDHFDIVSHNEEEQFVPQSDIALWAWDVTPLKSGNRYLRLHVSVRLKSETSEEKKDYPVTEMDIQVKVNLLYSTKQFVVHKYTWIIATILSLIGLGIKFL